MTVTVSYAPPLSSLMVPTAMSSARMEDEAVGGDWSVGSMFGVFCFVTLAMIDGG